jgi:branched-chain amino acid transport system permease protein
MPETKKEIYKFLLLVMVVISAGIVFADNYMMNVLLFVGINAMLAVALNLLLGFAGQISLGHAAFFGLGAYISGVLTSTYDFNPWLAMFTAAVATGMLAYMVGFQILKLKGHYLAMATLGLGMIIYIVFNETVDITGGPSGLSGIPNLSIGTFQFDTDLKNYILIWTFTLATVLFSSNLVNSRIGRALRAIHDSEIAARVMGVNAGLLKVQIFALSALISALAGSLYAHTVMFISPSSFGFKFSVELVTMVVIGGMGSIYGPLLGAVLLTLLPEFLVVLQDYDIVIYGFLLIVMTMFMPGGLVRGIPGLLSVLFPSTRERSGENA